MKPSFAKVALTPKWIGALFVALAVSAIFALLGQWQLERAFEQGPKAQVAKAAVELQELNPAGKPFANDYADRLVYSQYELNPNTFFIVKNRVQNGNTGYWVLNVAQTPNKENLVIALGFTTTEQQAKDSLEGQGLYDCSSGCLYEPSEDPQPKADHYLSVSVEQAINLKGVTGNKSFSGFVVAPYPHSPNLSTIEVGLAPKGTELNLLNAFYAAEWALFAGFAVFLWWRLVQDERLRQDDER